MRDLNLTSAERLILANQFEILGHLKKDKGLERLAEALKDGHKWLYEQSFDWFSEEMSDKVAQDVLKILEIYSSMRDSFRDLVDKTDLDESRLRFPGFDGNNEGDLMHFAKALRENDRYTDTLVGDLNSHMPTTEMYGRMVSQWYELGEPNYPYPREVIIKILEAQTHPSRREV
jgi:hypothetical protein